MTSETPFGFTENCDLHHHMKYPHGVGTFGPFLQGQLVPNGYRIDQAIAAIGPFGRAAMPVLAVG